MIHAHPALEILTRQLETHDTLAAKWFSDNYLKLNDEKSHLLKFDDKCSKAIATLRNSTINEI